MKVCSNTYSVNIRLEFIIFFALWLTSFIATSQISTALVNAPNPFFIGGKQSLLY